MQIYEIEKEFILDSTPFISRADARFVVPSKNKALANDGVSAVIQALKPVTVDPDTFWFPAILVTTNWNRNDDVFTPEETIKARYSPLSKPVSWMHRADEDANEVIGSINSVKAIDEAFNIIESSEDLAKLSKFHLAVGNIIWKSYFPTYADKIEDGIEDSSLFVSMECLFTDFGYALQQAGNNEIQLLDRNEQTAVLTKFLRSFKGPGKVTLNGVEYKIGRWLKNITFSGIGCVYNPANTDSIILVESPTLAFVTNEKEKSVAFLENSVLDLRDESNIMDKDKIIASEQALSEAKAKIEAMEKEMAEMKEAKAKIEASLAEASKVLAEKSEALNSAEAKMKDMEETCAKVEAKLKDMTEASAKVEAEKVEAEKTLASIKLDNLVNSRIAELNKVGSDLDLAKNKKALAEMSEDVFAMTLGVAKSAFEKVQAAVKVAEKADVTLEDSTKELESVKPTTKEEAELAIASASVKVNDDVTILSEGIAKLRKYRRAGV